MIEVQRYQESYFDILNAMLESQGSTRDLEPKDLPAIGFMASDSATHVAMGFLRIVEGNIAQIDGLTSNADLSSELRHKGVSMVVDKLIETAKALKLNGIIAFTVDKSTEVRALSRGFKLVPHKVLVYNLCE